MRACRAADPSSSVSRLLCADSGELSPAALALLAFAPDAIVRADARAPAVLADALLAVMRADARAPTAVLAFAPDAIVRADARAPAVLALAPDAVMRADARAPAVLAFLLMRFRGYAVAGHESLQIAGGGKP